MAPEPAAPAQPSSGGNVLTRRIGPLPTWAWVAIVGGVIVAYELYKSYSSGSTAASSTATPASDVPQFVNQTYVSGVPPTAPGPPGPTGPPGTGHSPNRRVATGEDTLTAIAKERGTTVAHLIAVTKAAPISAENLKKFLAAAAHPNRKLPKGTVFYTTN